MYLKKSLYFFTPLILCTITNLYSSPPFTTKNLDLFSGGGATAAFAAKFTLFIATILFVTVAVGKILRLLFRLPVVAGRIIGGIILGPSLLNIQGLKIFEEPLNIIDYASKKIYILASTDLFMFFVILLSSTITVAYLLWIAGHETDIQDMAKVGVVSTLAGFLAAFTPIVMISSTLSYFFKDSYNLVSSIGIGVVFAATSVSIPVAMLVSQKKMHFKFAKATMGASIIDDILAIIIFSVFSVLLQGGTLGKSYCSTTFSGHQCNIWSSMLYMILSFVLMFLIGRFFIKNANHWFKKFHFNHLIPPFAIAMMLAYFSLAEILGGLAGITGAYFAGLFQRMGDEKHNAERIISPYVNVFLLPLFLGSVGMQVDISKVNSSSWIIVLFLLFVATISKMIGCYFSTTIANLFQKKNKWSNLESYLFGSSMVARGEVGLVLATILKGTQLINLEQYVICVTVIVLTTIVTPIMLSIGFVWLDKKAEEKETKQIRKIKIGPFNYLSSRQIFNIITTIDLPSPIKSVVQLAEAKKVLTLSNNLKVVLRPEEGIYIEGNEKQINDLLSALKKSLDLDIDLIPNHLPPTETQI
ncbi:MAG: cation:proton antiporter [bacterium]